MTISASDKEFLLNNIRQTREKLSLYTVKAQLDFTLPTPKEIYDYLDDYVISQDRAKKILSVGAHNHYKRLMIFKDEGYDDKNKIEKTNLMLLGPTGSGKTYLVKKLAEMMKVPYYIADANNMTASGYVGKDVESVVDGLFPGLHASRRRRVREGRLWSTTPARVPRRAGVMGGGVFRMVEERHAM